MPFTETDPADHPLTIYAATKKAGELMAHNYAHLWNIPVTAVRFFTVYGPWGRPDMALFKFVDAILNDRPIEIYGEGRMSRDFTYVGDLVEAMVRLVPCVPAARASVEIVPGDSLSPIAPFRVINIGRGAPIALLDFVEAIEAGARPEGGAHFAADAAGRRPRDFCECGLAGAANRLSARDRGGGRGGQVCRLVSRILRSITAVCPANRSAL
jgi:UDP-glucuronate 4-epimerase